MNGAKQGRVVVVIFAVSLLLALSILGWAQSVQLTSDQEENPVKLQAALKTLLNGGAASKQIFALSLASKLTQESGFSEIAQQSLLSLKMRGDQVQVVIEVMAEDESPKIAQWVVQVGGEVELVYERWVQAFVPVRELESLEEMPEVQFIRLPVRPFLAQGPTRSEGLQVIGSEAWNQAGLTGDGVKVGIIDSGFKGYKGLLGRELPPADKVVTKSFREDKDIECLDCSEVEQLHGRGVAEIVYDVAPGVSLYLANFDTDVSFRQAVDWIVEQKVDVINTSLGFLSGCFRPGGGIFEPYFVKARQNGITWATAAGNEADTHWEGSWSDPDGDNLHNYTATDEGNTLDVVLVRFEYPDGRVVATSIIAVQFSWDASCTNALDDYEVVVMKEQDGRFEPLPPWSDQTQTGQFTDWVWRPGVPIKFTFASEDFDVERVGQIEKYHLSIRKKRADAADSRFDMIIGCLCRRIEYLKPEGSVSILEPSISPNVITVGAIHHSSSRCSRSLCPDGRLLVYSSQGPTKDGRIKPDIAAPSHVSTTAFRRWTGEGRNQNSGFTGTSAASPHAAGAAALVKQAFPDFTPEQVQKFLEGRAEDAAEPGKDNKYGSGILFLGQPPGQPQAPTITGIDPASGLQGSTVPATISGTNLTGATSITFSGTGVNAVIRAGGTDAALPVTITIAPDAAPGARTFQVTTPGGTADSGNITFTVLEAPRIGVEPQSLSFSAVVGGEAPQSQSLKINNLGGGTLSWQASVDAPWLILSATEGTAPSEIQVSVTIAGLAAGTHEGHIKITAPQALNSPLDIPVTLTLKEAPPPAEGQLIVLVFKELEFVEPADWQRELREGCVVYTNISDGPSLVRVVLPDDSVKEFEVPSGNEVIVCGSTVHIDTRPRPPQ